MSIVSGKDLKRRDWPSGTVRQEEIPVGIVHREGASRTSSGVPGLLPGSTGDSGSVVSGPGNRVAHSSAAHGARRKLSRRHALKSVSREKRDLYLKMQQITLIGGGLDESPQAYKPIREVMAAQEELLR